MLSLQDSQGGTGQAAAATADARALRTAGYAHRATATGYKSLSRIDAFPFALTLALVFVFDLAFDFASALGDAPDVLAFSHFRGRRRPGGHWYHATDR